MTALKRIEARCQHCHQWFQTGIKFPESQDFDAKVFVGMLKECPHCGEDTSLTNQNIRVRAPQEQ